jgi:pimeloyl-ACP methyl ester carboxylesterase
MLYLHGARWSLSTICIASGSCTGWASRSRDDYRGSAAATRPPFGGAGYADAQAASRPRRCARSSRFLYGHSLGGAVAIDLATRNDDVAGLIVSELTSIRDMWMLSATRASRSMA